MGLDMYLYGKKFLWNDSEEQNKVSEALPQMKRNPKYVEYELMYWRKANHIHRWFVSNVQNDEDVCGEYEVSKDDLIKLLTLISNVLANKDIAPEVLPTGAGFFFGNTNYDDFYFGSLERTKKELEEILSDPELSKMDYYYSSSW